MTVKEAKKYLVEAEEDLLSAKRNLKKAIDQEACQHLRVDNPGSIFGETCLDCELYLNNGF